MNNKIIAVSLYTIMRRELVRLFRIASQTFLPPIITISLYFIIFGNLIGNRIGLMQGYSYAQYITPGLIMLTVINNAYSNVVTSFFSARFQRSVEEVLISPTPNWAILLGFVSGGVFRGLLIAIGITFLASFFIPLSIHHIPTTISMLLLTTMLFSLAGFTNGMLARTFDEVAIIPSFVLTPLTYLGGVFYSIKLLPTNLQTIASLNPILYMVDTFRYGLLGIHDTNLVIAFGLVTSCVIMLSILNLYMLYRGIGLKQ